MPTLEPIHKSAITFVSMIVLTGIAISGYLTVDGRRSWLVVAAIGGVGTLVIAHQLFSMVLE